MRDGSSTAERATHNCRRGSSTLPRPISELVASLSPAVVKKLNALKFVRHKSARSLWLYNLQPMMDEIGETDPNTMLLGGEFTADQMIENIEWMGFWGFAEPKKNQIHCWWKRGVCQEQLLALIAHELEHIARKHSRFRGDFEERRCDLTGAIAAKAWQLLKSSTSQR